MWYYNTVFQCRTYSLQWKNILLLQIQSQCCLTAKGNSAWVSAVWGLEFILLPSRGSRRGSLMEKCLQRGIRQGANEHVFFFNSNHHCNVNKCRGEIKAASLLRETFVQDVVYLAITPGREDMLICCLDRERSRMYTEPERPLKMYTVHEGGVRRRSRGETRLAVTVKLLICNNKMRMPLLRNKNSLLYH